jgi:drug/metabolite transporter (DMT)-like permease
MSSSALSSQTSRSPVLLVPALLACYLVWGSTYLAIRLALQSFPPFFQMGTRFLTAGVLLLGWVMLRGEALPTARQWRNALVIGTLMLAGGMGLVAVASQHVGSGLIATCIAVMPMMMCGWSLLWGQRTGRLELAGMALGLLGVALLSRGASFSGAPVGIVSVLGATLCWSLGSALSTHRLPLASGASGFASEMLCGGAVLMLISLAVGEQTAWPPKPAALAAWAYLVLFGSLIAFSAYLYLLAHASPALATSYAFVNPLIALALGVWIGGEIVTAPEWIACAVILSGVALILLAGTRGAQEQA